MAIKKYKNRIFDVSHSVTDGGERNTVIHCHTNYEILYIERGEVLYYIEGMEYRTSAGGLLLIPPGVLHGVKACAEYTYQRYVVSIGTQALETEGRQLLLQAFLRQSYYEDTERFGIREAIEDIFRMSEISDFAANSALWLLISKILYLQNHADETVPRVTASDTITSIIGYINTNFREDITLDRISAKFFISKHHLNKLFRAACGTTVGEYIIHKRVNYARELISRGIRAGEAAVSAGFTDYSTFYRAYRKRMGVSPTDKK